jgi:hypothetical protein
LHLIILKRHLLSVSDTESILRLNGELRRGQRFELAAEVGDLFEAQFQGYHLDWLAGKQQWLRSFDPLFIQPVLRCARQITAEVAFQLPDGKMAPTKERFQVKKDWP